MKITEVEIRNFRSVVEPLVIPFHGRYLALVGQNNVGKSNVARCLELFLRGTIEGGGYQAERDMPQQLFRRADPNDLTVVRVKLDVGDSKELQKRYEQLLGHLKLPPASAPHTVDASLEISRGGSETLYLLGAPWGRRNAGRAGEEFLKTVRETVDFRYLPAVKDVMRVLDDQLLREVVGRILDGFAKGRTRIGEIQQQKLRVQKLLRDLQKLVDQPAAQVDDLFASVFPVVRQFRLMIPAADTRDVLGGLLPTMCDSYLGSSLVGATETPLAMKGAGVQGSAGVFLFKLLWELRPRNTWRGSRFVWVLEEPEASLHPSAQRDLASVIREYAAEGHVVVTTHSPSFLSSEPGENVLLERRATAETYYRFDPLGRALRKKGRPNPDATAAKLRAKSPSLSHRVLARLANDPLDTTAVAQRTAVTWWQPFFEAVGSSLADTPDFGDYNVLVEGPSDVLILEKANAVLCATDPNAGLPPARTVFIPSGGALFQAAQHTALHRLKGEGCWIVSLWDNDRAGRKSANDLRSGSQRTCGRQFCEGTDYLFYEHPEAGDARIEDLFPCELMERVRLKHKAHVRCTRQGERVWWDVDDGYKVKVATTITELAVPDDYSVVSTLLERVRHALRAQGAEV